MFTGIGVLATLSAWGPNVSELAETEKEGAAPVPLRATVCVARPLPALMLKVEEAAPEALGLNTTLMLQLAPTAMDVPQVLVWENG